MKARLFALLALFMLATSFFVVLAAPAFAVQPDEILSDAKLEQRARKISADLRCLVCQNQSIDDSDASLAKDLRILVREHLKAGESDSAIREFLVARYGNFILLKPPFAWDTWLLWLTPFALLALGALAIWTSSRAKSMEAAEAVPAPLSKEESEELIALLAASPGVNPAANPADSGR
jgi:cytochrome c-type biogenesis protein CcmH